MTTLFGRQWTRAELDRLLPDIGEVAGIRPLAFEDGSGRGARLIQIDSGGGLRVDLLPDRSCDIGQVWCNGTPFAWTNPMGYPTPSAARNNSPLSGLMTTCGFEHVRQPVHDNGRDYPLHGSAMHVPAKILSAAPVWIGDDCVFEIVAEVTQFSLSGGAFRLLRRIGVPLGGRSLSVSDTVTLLSGEAPLMALYHINLGFPLIGEDSVLMLNDADISARLKKPIDIGLSGAETARVRLAGGPQPGDPAFELAYRADTLPYLQTFSNRADGINVVAIEPVSHDRRPRAELREAGQLVPLERGASRAFFLEMTFSGGQW
ncbi:DUF4432 family protein [Martelella endophytica]|uniref:DUF4432 domain-containing protein n=1 Tax=Martelella endophytica TaxID=1486262 RepID=A0A0D5LND4_MAREN|nr:DUF4432 family protein [Martelella endophytica]AJY44828.1 hypothetical protein TM49_02600 [Martelella endophytica]